MVQTRQWLLFVCDFCLLDSEKGSLWDLGVLDWVQQKAECLRFCVGRSVTPLGQLPVSTDIEYEFGSRNPYNFLQVTYYKVSKFYGNHVCQNDFKSIFFLLLIYYWRHTILSLLISWKRCRKRRRQLIRTLLPTPVTWKWGITLRSIDGWREWLRRPSTTGR